MDLESLRAFVAFVDAGCQLTAGGKAIGLSQPAMHARLSGLARDVDVVLYERRGPKLMLTPQGAQVLAFARDSLERERALRRTLDGDLDDGAVVVACGEGALVHVVADRVATFAKANAGALSFRVVDGPTSMELVRRGEAHVAVLAGPAAVARDLRSDVLVTTSLCAIGVRRFFVGGGDDDLDLDALWSLPLLVPPTGRPLRTTLEEAAAARGRALLVAVEVTGWEAVVRLAKLGVGVGVINDVVATTGLVRRGIRGVPATTYRVLRRRGTPTAAVAAMLAALHG